MFLLISAVAVGTAGSYGIFADKVRCAARLAHGIIEMAESRREVIEPELFHQGADSAFCESALISAPVGIFIEIHIP